MKLVSAAIDSKQVENSKVIVELSYNDLKAVFEAVSQSGEQNQSITDNLIDIMGQAQATE